MADEDNKPQDQPMEPAQTESLLTIEVNEEYVDGEDGAGETFDATAFQATRNIISKQIQQIDEIRKEQNLYVEQLRDLVENNEVFVNADKTAKEAAKEAKEIKTNIMQSQTAKNLKTQITESRQTLKELREALSAHLLSLYQTTGVMEYESPEGEVYEYKISAKLGAKKS